MFGQKPVMPVEWTIASCTVIDWADEMSWEELLAMRIWQIERWLEDVERAKAKLLATREKNKE